MRGSDWGSGISDCRLKIFHRQERKERKVLRMVNCAVCALCGETVSSWIKATRVSLLPSFALIRVDPRASVVLFILLKALVSKIGDFKFDCIHFLRRVYA
jgi:hypothetical protein